ncbi:unnamed protein product [Vitrella brassicaformis CCMP3155]|uniref:Dipeptidyl peptidase 1 n=1 Tax=Vitrella brassicaformis (strain CCMP3155) TaxID=1169540 RepID=A0A0G4FBX7_VITBC|nr:unnamed protein product [Vitrella brassicaformis CCMP3155]|eukprot:CEM10106.1 unnamed protein product [Vitrella brassicaformis CCMP3155]
MTMKGLLLALIVLLALIRNVRSDLPVHCLTSDVAGLWRFCLDRDRDVHLPRCGSDTPNTNLGNLRLSNYSSWLEANRGGVGECITVQLTTDEAADGTSGREDWKRLVVRDGDRTSGDIGRWTMVDDEGFEVCLDNGRVLFAFSHYAPTSEANCPPPHNGLGEDNHGRTQCYVSHCHKTQIGWHSDASEYGCFVGSKLSNRTLRPPRTTNYVRHIAPSADSTQPDSEGDANTPTTTTTALGTGVCASRRPMFVRYHHHPPSDDVIPPPNSFILEPGRRPTIGSVLRRSGGVSFLQSRALFASNFPCPSAATSTPPTTETRGGQHELPASFSCEGELGVSGDDVINQQDCGSCYAIASAYALQSRFRIELSRRGVRDVTPVLSAQAVLSCSPYNQGCDGGYPFLVGKHASEVGLHEERCLGYAATHTNVPCPTAHTPVSDDCRSLWFAKSYLYAAHLASFIGAVTMPSPINIIIASTLLVKRVSAMKQDQCPAEPKDPASITEEDIRAILKDSHQVLHGTASMLPGGQLPSSQDLFPNDPHGEVQWYFDDDGDGDNDGGNKQAQQPTCAALTQIAAGGAK